MIAKSNIKFEILKIVMRNTANVTKMVKPAVNSRKETATSCYVEVNK